jgi:hypothetical protein
MQNCFNNIPRKNVNVNVVNQNVVHQHDYQNRKHKRKRKEFSQDNYEITKITKELF